MEKAGQAFDAMFDDDQQEQLITLTEREDRVLEKGAELQEWLLARHLATDPTARPGKAEPVKALKELDGVGTFVAMVFLTEMGDLSRFGNRRQVPCYMGIVPSSDESGEISDRKGHITHQGSWRLRKVLCQAAWARIRSNEGARALSHRLVERNLKNKKIATVAVMRRLSIRMWHVGLAAQKRAGCFAEGAGA